MARAISSSMARVISMALRCQQLDERALGAAQRPAVMSQPRSGERTQPTAQAVGTAAQE